ncbi:hypothetical protein D0T85_22285, partial [Bacteroides sp. 519]
GALQDMDRAVVIGTRTFGKGNAGKHNGVPGDLLIQVQEEAHPDLPIDGEMQVNFALNKELRDAKYPFTAPASSQGNIDIVAEPG